MPVGSPHGICEISLRGEPREPQILVERPDLIQLQHLAVDLASRKPRRCSLGQFLAIFTLSPGHDRASM